VIVEHGFPFSKHDNPCSQRSREHTVETVPLRE